MSNLIIIAAVVVVILLFLGVITITVR